jgi:hypothetical protein
MVEGSVGTIDATVQTTCHLSARIFSLIAIVYAAAAVGPHAAKSKTVRCRIGHWLGLLAHGTSTPLLW